MGTKANLLISREIFKDFHKLPKKIQKKVAEFHRDFQSNPEAESLYVHKLDATMLDPKVRGAKIGSSGYRAILIKPEKGNTWLLVRVDAHDKAYDWAKNKRFEVHESTGVLQVFDEAELQGVIEEKREDFSTSAADEYPLKKLSDDELFAAGLPRVLIPSIRELNSDEDFDKIADYLPPDCREVLTGLAAGMSLDEALESVLGAEKEDLKKPESTGDFSHLTEAPSFGLVMLESDDLLKDALDGPIDEWRVFLHPQQRRIVERETTGPMKITGAAGTGKTVALIHRAVHLAKGHVEDAQKTLFLTFTINLANNIEKLFKTLDEDAAALIEVTHLSRLARSICREAGWNGVVRLPTDERIDGIQEVWDEVFHEEGLPENPLETRAELVEEFLSVIDPSGIESEDEYLTVRRTGRPRLARKKRRDVWRYIEVLRREIKKRDILTPNGAVKQARLAYEQNPTRDYAHVLVDEVQDFGLEALKFIAALGLRKEDAPNPLTLAGDGHQRVYGFKVPLSHAGISVRGRRSVRLRINYRTTQQIRLWAQGVLDGVEIDDLDDEAADIRGDRSLYRGEYGPEIRSASSEREQAETVVEWIQMLLDEGIAPHEICITPESEVIVQALEASKIQSRQLYAQQPDLGELEPGVRIGAMERIKGLEFRAVALACADKNDPLNNLGESDLAERCMRYVAATRARERLLVIQHSGEKM